MSEDELHRKSGTNSSIDAQDNRRNGEPARAEPWKDEDHLRYLYHEQGLSQAEIGRRFDVTKQTVKYWMGKLGIEARPPMNERERSISRSVREDGKVQYKVPNVEELERFYRHQLVALLAEDVDGGWAYSPAEVFADDTHTHHEIHSPVGLDLPENLAVLDASEHIKLHGSGYLSETEAVLGEIFDDYEGEPEIEPVDFEKLRDALKRDQTKEAKLRQWRGTA